MKTAKEWLSDNGYGTGNICNFSLNGLAELMEMFKRESEHMEVSEGKKEEHKCQYCGCMTTQSDDVCWNKPNQLEQEDSSICYNQVVDMDYDEKMNMYLSLDKGRLCEMVIECNRVINSLTKQSELPRPSDNMAAENYFNLMKDNLRDYNPVYTPWINEIIKLAKQSAIPSPTDEDIERAADKYSQVPVIWNAYKQGAKDMRDNKIKIEKL